ncbi:MAG TPA: hypothetical protein VJX67_08555, partial [Blastocatellia bacterium]|nr:hypothetical protein [Blastocatellia bacterium]
GSLEVDWDAAYNMKRDPKTDEYPEGSQARTRSADFNIGYTEFLRQLHSAFNGKRELLVPAVGNMFDIKYNAIELIKNPFPGKEGLNAGPAFEYAGDATLEPSPG